MDWKSGFEIKCKALKSFKNDEFDSYEYFWTSEVINIVWLFSSTSL